MVDDKKGLVSIVLPTYNGSRYIAQSIESCLNQTHDNIELIIVNDASTDSTEEIITSYQDTRIIYLNNSENLGLAESLNVGFSESRGEYLTWTSDDNYYVQDALSKMLSELIKTRGTDFVYANYNRIDKNGKLIDKMQVDKSLCLLRENCIGPCFLYKRKVYEKIGGYDPGFFLAEDYEYWIRILKHFRMKNLNDYLYYFRLHGDSLTSNYPIEKARVVVKYALEKHITLNIKIQYRLMLYMDKFIRRFFTKRGEKRVS